MRSHALTLVRDVANIIERSIREKASLTCHSLETLARMGHPYAVRDPRNPHSPPYLIHTQSGKLLNAIGQRLEETKDKITIYVGVDEDKAPHVQYLIFGTEKMISRDFISGAFNEVLDEIKAKFK